MNDERELFKKRMLKLKCLFWRTRNVLSSPACTRACWSSLTNFGIP